jgi:CBS domain-containing protein
MLDSIQIDDFMTISPVIFSPETELYEAVHILLENKVTGGTVLDEEGHVLGVVSEMDLLKALENVSYYNEGGGKVGDYMTTEVVAIEEHMNIFDVANKLLELKIRRLPVVRHGKFAGQVSCRSILQAMKDSMCEHDKAEDEILE